MTSTGEIVFEKMPITILGEDAKIELVATATLGKGIDHAKNISGLCYYRHILEISSSPKIDQIVENAKGLINPEKKGNKWLCDINEAVIEKVKGIEKNSVNDSSEILFIIESFGNMPAKDILSKAIEALSDNLDEFEKAID